MEKKRILIVEDAPYMRETIEMMLDTRDMKLWVLPLMEGKP